MDNVWNALDEWAVKLGLLANEEDGQRYAAIDLDAKVLAQHTRVVSEFTARRNRIDIMSASRAAVAA